MARPGSYSSKYQLRLLQWHLSSTLCPGRCSSMGWALACKPKSRRFDSQSGHMPELQAWPLAPGWGSVRHSACVYPPWRCGPSLREDGVLDDLQSRDVGVWNAVSCRFSYKTVKTKTVKEYVRQMMSWIVFALFCRSTSCLAPPVLWT